MTCELSDASILDALLDSLGGRQPFSFELLGENGSMLTVAWSPEITCVQYSPSDGQPPYLMALGAPTDDPDEYLDFLTGGTPTPLATVLYADCEGQTGYLDFLRDGQRSSKVEWEEI